MAKSTAPKTYSVPTTNFILHLDKIDKVSLEANYQLYCVEIPDSFGFSQDGNKYAKLHNAYKEQLELPYYFYSFAKPKATIYILLEKSKDKDNPISLTFDFLDKKPISAHRSNITDLCTDDNLHILAKLFLADYFYNQNKTYRICQANFCIHSEVYKDKATILEVEISKVKKGSPDFQIKHKATYLLKADKKYVKLDYVGSDVYCELLQGTKYYRQLKTSFVKSWQADDKNTTEIWKVENSFDRKSNSKRKNPTIKWFEDYENITRCKSFLLQEFQEKLTKYYNQILGKGSAENQNYLMTKVEPITQFAIKGYGENTGLYLKLLGEVGIYDNRFKEIETKNQIPFQQFIDFFNAHYAKKYEIRFSEISKEELKKTTKAVLVLQDVEKQIFEEDGFLLGYDDPKKLLYQDFSKKIAFQTLTINTNKAEEHTAETYFDYDVLDECLKHLGNSFAQIKENLSNEEKTIIELYKNEKAINGDVSEESKERRKQNEKLKSHFSLITNKIDVCLNELLLKYYLVNELPIKSFDNPNHSLPCIFKISDLVNYSYMYKGFLMYADEKHILKFIDLRNKDGKDKRNEYLKTLDIEWIEVEKIFSERNYTRDKNGQDIINRFGNKTENAMKDTHFVFLNGLALAIEDTEERVLHKYSSEKQGKSQRAGEHKTALEGIYYSEEKQVYTVGEKSMNMDMDKSVIVRKIHYYQKPENFKFDSLLQTLTAQFVRNQQFTVYPYFFDLLNIYQKDIIRTE